MAINFAEENNIRTKKIKKLSKIHLISTILFFFIAILNPIFCNPVYTVFSFFSLIIYIIINIILMLKI